MNAVESLLYATAGIVMIAIIHNGHDHLTFNVTLAVIILPSVVFAGIIVFRVLKVLGIVAATRTLLCQVTQQRKCFCAETEADRLVNPTEYSPLLN